MSLLRMIELWGGGELRLLILDGRTWRCCSSGDRRGLSGLGGTWIMSSLSSSLCCV